MARVGSDCRRTPSVSGCSLVIAGEENEAVEAITAHMVAVHGHEDTPELREQVRRELIPESEITKTTGQQPSAPPPG